MTALEEYLVEPFEPDETEPRPFRVDGLGTAEWVAAKLRRARAEREALEAEHAAWRKRADEWLVNESKKWDHDIQWAEALLTRWMEDERDTTGRKSIRLPSGTVLSSRESVRLVKDNERLLCDWLESIGRDDLYRRTPETTDVRMLVEQAAATVSALIGWQVPAEVPGAVVVRDVSYSVKP